MLFGFYIFIGGVLMIIGGIGSAWSARSRAARGSWVGGFRVVDIDESSKTEEHIVFCQAVAWAGLVITLVGALMYWVV